MESSLKRVRKAFTYNIMVCGRSGLGKSTFIRTLLSDSAFIPREDDAPKVLSSAKTTAIQVHSTEIELDQKKVNLSIIDTPGFGDAINNNASVEVVLAYVQDQFQAYLQEESRVKRNPKFLDPRVHIVLYFIPPTGHGLSELDLLLLSRLSPYANIIPVVAKSDTMGEAEMKAFKAQVMNQINNEKIHLFEFPDTDDADPEFLAANKMLRSTMPFAIVGSEAVHEISGRKIRGRRYGWGVVDVDNPAHCDFVKLRNVLLSTHIEDLKEVTGEVLYERYREQDLIKKGRPDGPLDSPLGAEEGSKVKKEKKPKKDREQEAVPAAS